MGLFAPYEPQAPSQPAVADLWTRPALDADLDALAALRVERGDATAAQASEVFARWLRRAREGEALLLAAGVGLRLVAYAVAERLALPGLPPGWYLGGVVVAPDLRRRGVATRLTQERLGWIAERAAQAYYFVNAQNRASIDLHARWQFRELVHGVAVPGVTFAGGVGVLFVAEVRR